MSEALLPSQELGFDLYREGGTFRNPELERAFQDWLARYSEGPADDE